MDSCQRHLFVSTIGPFFSHVQAIVFRCNPIAVHIKLHSESPGIDTTKSLHADGQNTKATRIVVRCAWCMVCLFCGNMPEDWGDQEIERRQFLVDLNPVRLRVFEVTVARVAGAENSHR